MRNPIDLLTGRLPREWRVAIDWAVTIIGAVLIVLGIKAYVVNPYRIPSSSMEPTLHCAMPGAGLRVGPFLRPRPGESLHLPLPRPQARRDRRLQDAAASAGAVRGGRDLRQAPRRPPGRPLARGERRHLHQRQEAGRAVHPRGPPRRRHASRADDPEGQLPHARRQPAVVVRLAPLGLRPAGQPDRPRVRRVLPAEADHLILSRCRGSSASC